MDPPLKRCGSTKLPFDDNRRSVKGEQILATAVFSDVTITVKDKGREKAFRGHKVLLVMISPVFEAMLSGNFIEKNEILIEDVDPDVFQIFFNYLYLQTLDIPDISHAWEVYRLALKYIVKPVCDCCINYIKENCNITTCAINYNYADFFGMEDIKMRNYELILNNLLTYFGQPEFLTLSKSAIASILDEPVLSVDEPELFINLEKWIRAQISLKAENEERDQLHKDLKEELLQKIHFLEMSPKEFADAVGSSQTLTRRQKLSIFMNMCGSNKEHPLEGGIQKFDKKRLKSLDCHCGGYTFKCNICNFDLHCLQFKGSSFLRLCKVFFGTSGTKMSFRFRMSSQNDTILFTAQQKSYVFKIHGEATFSNRKLSVQYSQTCVNFANIVTDGRPHIISLSFSSNSCNVAMDGNNECLRINFNEHLTDYQFGSSSNGSESHFCLSSVTFGSNPECVDLKDYHSGTEGITLCRCMSS